MTAMLKARVPATAPEFKTQYALPLSAGDDAIIVDLFAGGGGASTGIEMGLGRKVALAINHDPAAISMHQANHPGALHLRNNVWAIDPLVAVMKRVVGWLHASPDCTHHSQAAGGQPRKKEIRDLAWVVIKWAGVLRKRGQGPWVISMENVRQMALWGRLIAKRDKATGRVVKLDGSVAEPGERVPRHEQFLIPDPAHKGRTWKRFIRALEGLGYQVSWWIERNCDYGDPTTRERLYLIATADGHAPVAPQKTHAAVPTKGLAPYRTASECIDWSDLGTSLRTRKRPLADATHRRVAKGIQKESLQRARPFIVPLTHQGGDRLHSLTEPCRTITAPNRGELALAVPTFVQVGYGERQGQQPRVLDLQKPLGTVVAGGTKHALATAFLAQANGGYNTTHSRAADSPISTITNRGSQQQLVTANLVTLRKGSAAGVIDRPLGTQTCGDHHALVTAETVWGALSDDELAGALWCADFLTHYLADGEAWALGSEFGPVLFTADGRPLVTVWVDGNPCVIVDIRLRMLKPRELYRAQGFPDTYIIDRGHDGKPLTLTQQIHMCGNSVSPGTMAAFARANDPWKRLAQERRAA